MAHSFDVWSSALNDRSRNFLPQRLVTTNVLQAEFQFPRECAVNGAFGNGF
jgi:hypothetical protein